jgi:DNA-binding HxlR family transcriptional regulator
MRRTASPAAAALAAIRCSEPAERCSMVRFVDLIAGKWAIPILYRLILIGEPVRFSELQRAVAPITQKELTRQLRAFEANGLVSRTVYPEVPPRVEYRITALGATLRDPLAGLAQWMERHGGRVRRAAQD